MFSFLDPQQLITTLGIVGVIAIVFAESGLFFGFFLPGDSLLFTAGFLASQGYINIWVLLIGTFLAAVIGDAVGFYFGKKVGSKLLKPKHLQMTQDFYAKHGKKTIVLARFTPVIRTFAPIVAGMGDMKYSVFLTFNIIGGLLWTWSLLLAGFWLGNFIPGIDQYIVPIVIGIVVISVLPGVVHFFPKKKL